jgi:hypothetical protein
MARKPKSKIVTAVGVSSSSLSRAGSAAAAEIEAAMVKAIETANAEGINDPDEIKRRMTAARNEVRARHALPLVEVPK